MKSVILCLSLLLITGCAEKRLTPMASQPQQMPPSDMSFIQELKSSIRQLKRTLKENTETSPYMFVPLKVKIFPAGATLKEAFEANDFKPVFNPPELGNISFAGIQHFNTFADMIKAIKQLGLFVNITGNEVTISKIGEKTYEVGQLLKIMTKKTLLSLLHDDEAWIDIRPETGTLVVYDDMTGHEKIEDYIETLSSLMQQSYNYSITVTKRGEIKHQYSGLLEPAVSGSLGPGGSIYVITYADGTASVTVFMAGMTAPVSFRMKSIEQTWETQDDEKLITIYIRRTP